MIYDFGMAESRQDIVKSFRTPGQPNKYFVEKSIKDYTRIMNAFMNRKNGGWINHTLFPSINVTIIMKKLSEFLKSNSRMYRDESDVFEDILGSFRKESVINDRLSRRTKVINNVPFII
mgnify:CR=1 FL=1